jgi:hypothetical protein
MASVDTSRAYSTTSSVRNKEAQALLLLIQEPAPKEAPGCSIVKVEMAVGAEVFAGKELPVGLGDQPDKLLVGELFELFWRY